ncbi:ribonuclease J [Paenibacillus sp. OV219]|nr:ribonuclease J [Paenibacillus sp. OV219]
MLDNQDKIRGVVVTHGHEDHIGGVPYVIKQLNMPIFATSLTLGLIKEKLREHGLLNNTLLYEIDSNSELTLGTVMVRFFRTIHSIPDCLGIAFQTALGTIVHTGDFKFDFTPVTNNTQIFIKWPRSARMVYLHCYPRARMLNDRVH